MTRQRIDSALEHLGRRRLRHEDVHAARKAIKKARAELRLLRPGLKHAVYRRQNTALRDATHPLSAVRDAKVMGESLSNLLQRYRAAARITRLDGFAHALGRRCAEAQRVLSGDGALAHARGLLRQASRRVARASVHGDQWRTLGAGLKRVYAEGRNAMRGARAKPTPECFHEWRKQVKYLRYQIEIFERLWPKVMRTCADQAHELANCPRDDHDLTLLRKAALAGNDLFPRAESRDALVALIERQQRLLRSKALRLGSRLYEESLRPDRAARPILGSVAARERTELSSAPPPCTASPRAAVGAFATAALATAGCARLATLTTWQDSIRPCNFLFGSWSVDWPYCSLRSQQMY